MIHGNDWAHMEIEIELTLFHIAHTGDMSKRLYYDNSVDSFYGLSSHSTEQSDIPLFF